MLLCLSSQSFSGGFHDFNLRLQYGQHILKICNQQIRPQQLKQLAEGLPLTEDAQNYYYHYLLLLLLLLLSSSSPLLKFIIIINIIINMQV